MTAAIVSDGPLAPTLLSPRWRGDRVPAALRRRTARLLNQQFWCWGQDIRGDEGNLLLRYGFSRHRPPWQKRGSSAYTLYLDRDRCVVLWGFGLFYGARATGGLFLPRYDCEPHLMPSATPPSTVWEPQQLALPCAPASSGGRHSVCWRPPATGSAPTRSGF